jgi:hypothetical protein
MKNTFTLFASAFTALVLNAAAVELPFDPTPATTAPAPAEAPTLGIAHGVFTADGQPFQMWGIRVASATASDAQTEHLIAQLDEYKAHGLNAVTVFYQGSRSANYDPFKPDGSEVDAGHQRRMERIITECGRRRMFVIVGIFYQHAPLRLRDADAVRAALRLVTERLKPYPNILINVANEQGCDGYEDTKHIYDFRDPERVIELCRLVRQTDPRRLVGSGGYYFKNNVVIGRSPDVDALLFDFNKAEKLTGEICAEYVKQGVTGKPLVNVELLGAWTKEFPRGIFPEHVKQRHYDEVASVLGSPQFGMFYHNSNWCQVEPMRYDLAGQGTGTDPGIRWFFEWLRKAIQP